MATKSRAINGHNPAARAEATVPRWRSATPSPLQLRHAAEPEHGHHWQPVRGPHLRPVHAKHGKSRTGVVGISYGIRNMKRKTTPEPLVRHFYFVQLGGTNTSFCLETLGKAEAWRRAVRCRAEHELKIRRANAAILAARKAQTKKGAQ